jgi:hypothetical protein
VLSANPFLWFALGLTAWGLWRLVRWAASGGRLPLRGRRGTAGGFTGAGLAVQEFYQPGARHAIERLEQEEMQREDDEDGDPPEPGEGR